MNLRVAVPNLVLPWGATKDEEDRAFQRILGWCALPFMVLAVVIPLIDTPEPQRQVVDVEPPQLARIILEEQKPSRPAPEPIAEPEPAVEAAAKPKPEPAEPEQARAKAEQSGVLKFADELSRMRNGVNAADVRNAPASASDADDASSRESAQANREIIARRSNQTSGGIDTSRLSRDTGVAELTDREKTRIEDKMAVAEGSRTTIDGDAVGRSDEAIRKVMDRNKGAVFAIYNRALRRNPALEGRVVVKIVIDSNGAVSTAKIIFSDLDSPEVESKILARIRMIDFGAEAVSTTLNYELDFLPS